MEQILSEKELLKGRIRDCEQILKLANSGKQKHHNIIVETEEVLLRLLAQQRRKIGRAHV